MIGLVMTGGGARGAYQAGVLKRIGEIPRVRERGNPFLFRFYLNPASQNPLVPWEVD